MILIGNPPLTPLVTGVPSFVGTTSLLGLWSVPTFESSFNKHELMLFAVPYGRLKNPRTAHTSAPQLDIEREVPVVYQGISVVSSPCSN